MTFYKVNINSEVKIPKGNIGQELIFTKQKQKSQKAKRGEGSRKVREIFTFLVLVARLIDTIASNNSYRRKNSLLPFTLS